MNTVHTRLADAGLVRRDDHRIIGGVCTGLGHRYGLDPWAVRALFVLTLVLLPGSQILLYPIAWLLMPAEDAIVRSTGTLGPVVGPQDTAR